MTAPLWIALGALLVGVAYATGLALGHALFRRNILDPI